MNRIAANGSKENVQVKSMSIIVDGRPDFTLDLTGDLNKLPRLTLKEGAEYNIRIQFVINHEVINGLRYVEQTRRKGVRVSQESLMVGSYSPKKEVQSYTSPVLEVRKGSPNVRASYVVNSQFTDGHKNVILEWNWEYDIKKDWD